jgi:hypothetical protein
MPWELQALSTDDGGSLGTVEHVQAKLRAALPEIELFRDSSGSEKVASMESQGIEVPDVLREHWLRSRGAHQGLIEGDEFTIEFHLGEDDAAVVAVGINVRGSGDPMPVLQRLMRIEGWKVVDLNGRPPTADSWQSFRTWRDDAIEQTKDEGA